MTLIVPDSQAIRTGNRIRQRLSRWITRPTLFGHSLILLRFDDVVVIPRQEAEAILKRAHQRIALEHTWLARINRGELILTDSDEEFAARGCQIID
jgi:hypothetical protein